MSDEDDILVCVLCGELWCPEIKNACECGGFCTWGPSKGADPSSWIINEDGSWTARPRPCDVTVEVNVILQDGVDIETAANALAASGLHISEIFDEFGVIGGSVIQNKADRLLKVAGVLDVEYNRSLK